jgi:Mn2+/Fe2+ NRAMP family transporter
MSTSEMAVTHLAAVTAHPDLRALPGSNVLQQLVNGAEAWSLVVALLGAFIGAGLWAVASHSHNHQYAARGRMAALTSGAAALVVGAAPGLVNFFAHLGATAR